MTSTLPYTVVDAAASVSSGVLDSGAVQVARDLLAGYTGDYFFYQSAANSYNLVLASPDMIISGLNSLTQYVFDGDFFYYEIDITPRSHTEQFPISVQGGGAFSGPFNYGSHDGTYSGDFTVTVRDSPLYISQYRYDEDGVTIDNYGYVVFGSMEGLPHLVEGGIYYAYAEIALLVCIVLFGLVSRIFKHVS